MGKWFTPRQKSLVRAQNAVAVIGLGRFGQSLALELMDTGAEVLGIDSDDNLVQTMNGRLTHVVKADATKEDVLRQLSIPEMECAVVAIGSRIEASILCTSLLLGFGIPRIWAKAVTDTHGDILRRLGVKHVVYPEHEMGRRVAHLVRGALTDYIDLGDGFALVRTSPPQSVLNRSIREAQIRSRHGVTVITHKKGSGPWQEATGDTVLEAGDEIMVTGPSGKAEGFHLLG